MADKPKVRLSASRIKTAQDCSWRYYTDYVLKLRDGGNAGSGRGNCCHPVLEALLRPDRKKYYHQIVASRDVYSVPCIKRFIHIYAKKENVFDEENLKLINDFILVALDLDFYCEGHINLQSELKFEERDEKIWVLGFIDKISEFTDRVLLVDYKTQKNFFTEEELEFNVQAMMYLMVAKKMFPGKRIDFEFHQLKEARGRDKKLKNPIQKVPDVSDDMIEGFKEWLAAFSDYLSNFTLEEAKSNFAIKDYTKKMTRCGGVLGQRRKSDGGLMFCCPAKYARLYFALYENGILLKTAATRGELEEGIKEGQTIEQRSYGGCPAWKDIIG